ncbi:MAG: hypothetical protein GY906_07070 [bacterium]|nr:hypothetical protein [bacterium]
MKINNPCGAVDDGTISALQTQLEVCPDIAFAHLAEIVVPDTGVGPELVLFVWLRGDAVRSLRQALNLVSEAVARALPQDKYVDVAILNSAPELLEEVEEAGQLIVELDVDEHRRALEAIHADDETKPPTSSSSPWWWPF